MKVSKFNIFAAVLLTFCAAIEFHSKTAFATNLFCAATLWSLIVLEYLSKDKKVISIYNSFVFGMMNAVFCYQSYKDHSFIWMAITGLASLYCFGALIYDLYYETDEK